MDARPCYALVVVAGEQRNPTESHRQADEPPRVNSHKRRPSAKSFHQLSNSPLANLSLRFASILPDEFLTPAPALNGCLCFLGYYGHNQAFLLNRQIQIISVSPSCNCSVPALQAFLIKIFLMDFFSGFLLTPQRFSF